MKRVVDKCKQLYASVLEDILLFTPGKTTDPETGIEYDKKINDPIDNEKLIIYISNVEGVFKNLVSCIEDILFYEKMLNPENLPAFDQEDDFGLYLKLSFQGWLIKAISIFDCSIQAVNEVFEIGIQKEKVNRRVIMKEIESNKTIYSLLKSTEDLLQTELNQIKSANNKLRKVRDRIIHMNEFEQVDISEIFFYSMAINLKMLDTDRAFIQGGIGKISFELMDKVKKINFEIISNIYPLFEYLYQEYKTRFVARIK